MQGFHQLSLFTEGRHASQCLWLEGAEDRVTSDISGERFPGLSPTLCRVFSSLKTHLESFPLPRTRFARIWSASATRSGYAILKLRLSARSTGGRECFLWATPSAADCQGSHGGGQGKSLRTDVRLWPTPKASDAVMGMTARTSGRPLEKSTHLQARVHCAEMFPTPRAADAEKGTRSPEGTMKEMSRGHGMDLPSHVQIFPTPTVSGNHNRKGASGKAGDGLATAVKLLPAPTANGAKNNAAPSQKKRHSDALNVTAGGSLNPAWVEWLMGFPIGWTDLESDEPVKIPLDIEPDIPRTARGVKKRMHRLRALGNAVVPAQAYPIFKAISMTYEGRDVNEA